MSHQASKLHQRRPNPRCRCCCGGARLSPAACRSKRRRVVSAALTLVARRPRWSGSELKTHMASTADACCRVTQACERADFAGAVQLMREHASSVAVQKAACVALFPFTENPEDGSCVRVVAAGALDAVLATLELHREDSMLQANCCGLLNNIARAQFGVPIVCAACSLLCGGGAAGACCCPDGPDFRLSSAEDSCVYPRNPRHRGRCWRS
jgi:hypothetical protein